MLAVLLYRYWRGTPHNESTILQTVELLVDKGAFWDAADQAKARHYSFRVVLFVFEDSILHDGNERRFVSVV